MKGLSRLGAAVVAVFAVTAQATPPDQSTDATAMVGAMAMNGTLPMTLADWARGAQLYNGLGNFHRKITTRSPEAQRYFDQGMRLLWAFNHDESTRSFAYALQLDPTCAMCAWGVALTIGPNYNLPMLAEPRAKIAFEATNVARTLAPSGTDVEQALIAALAQRYPNAEPLDPQTEIPVLVGYAGAMRDVARRFPRDLDVQTFYAESMMNIRAWKLWNPDGTPADGTDQIVATLEAVLASNPAHMGALHYYVHAVEASPHPEKGIAAAERIRGIAPAAGHLEHMPAHIFHRVGRYEESAVANRKGAAADIAYLSKTVPLDYYPTMYISHNYQFLAFSTAAEGREAETVDAVRRSRDSVSDALLREMPGADWYVAELYAADVRFGRWDALLLQEPPAQDLPGLAGGYLYATAIALAAKDRPAEARDRLARLEKMIEGVPASAPAGAGQNSMRDVLIIGARMAEARIARAEGRTGDELSVLRRAVALEDALAYDEPAEWFFPVRDVLGAALLRTGGAIEAERVYRDDLERHPHNGWALFGLSQALKAEGRDAEAHSAEVEFRKAWSFATITINASAF
jgi:tetratricopeptide (TPR) repeat protein